MKKLKLSNMSYELILTNKDYKKLKSHKCRYIGKGQVIFNEKDGNGLWSSKSVLTYLHPELSRHKIFYKDGDIFNMMKSNLLLASELTKEERKELTKKRKEAIESLDEEFNSLVYEKLNKKYRGVQLTNSPYYRKRNIQPKSLSWNAKIMKNRKIYYLGTYYNPENAAKAYNTMAKKLFGKDAVLNEIGCPGKKYKLKELVTNK